VDLQSSHGPLGSLRKHLRARLVQGPHFILWPRAFVDVVLCPVENGGRLGFPDGAIGGMMAGCEMSSVSVTESC
jgi:hypothetical protein